ncbi:trans-sialidase [Trypanosoma cruzi]|nr:trans-sialidase [Trypanosoma cruzi]
MVATHGGHDGKVDESGEMGEEWLDFGGAHLNVLSEALKSATSGGRLEIVTVSIEGRSVMLFALPRQNNIRRATSVLRLYMTDMNRFYPIGPLCADGVSKNADTLRYKGGELFALYEWNAGKGRVVLAPSLSSWMK